ncbi:MAG: asparagine synthase (glutamine-hydrolyzing) [Acidobacteriota bacterium]|nr:asparagine synthase (glutamine-hydrolyzing) [Acidobacteriota bacterium]MDH3527954.1 asparagine synthase (glutamine-hydrolyzing) [Acidobacteriota bacterium]
MCGIAGWAYLDPKRPPMFGDEVMLSSMCDRIWHRGPDAEGIWMGHGVALGMRRLAVIDLETGEQPVWNEDRSIVVVMNGEIYNYRELRKDLVERGHKFCGNSDTEVIPHLYDELGETFLDVLNGMFAIALWDTRLEKLILARDRFGEKPLYYGTFDDRLFFASEPKALLTHPKIAPEIDPHALHQYLSYDYVPAPLSIYKGISKLPAAHRLVWEAGKITTIPYWKLSFAKDEKKPSVEDASSELRSLISKSVEERLVSDVPLGVLLSGGIDSSTVAAFAQQHTEGKVKTFSIGFEEDTFDESAYAKKVALHLGTDHHEERLSVSTAKTLITEIGGWLDEPLSDGSLIPTYLLSRFVREHVTVALGGDGGDEIFAGYPTYYGHKVARVYDAMPRFFKTGVIEPIVRNLSASTDNLSFDYKAKRFVSSADNDVVVRHHSWFGSFSGEEKQELLSDSVRSVIKDIDVYQSARQMLAECDAKDRIEQMQFLDMNLYLAEDILTKVDRASMAVSLEVRAPFLDHHVAEYAASLPAEYKLRGSSTKYILKKAVADLLPAEIINRPKKGFGMPVAKWLKGTLNPLMHEMLSPSRVIIQDLFNYEYVKELMREHEQGIANHYKQLWTLLVFQLWYENFIKQ